MLGGCGGNDQVTGASSGPSPSPSPTVIVSPPPAADDAQAVIAYLMLPDTAGMGPYAGWKKRESMEGKAKHLSLCSSHADKEIRSDAKVEFADARLAQYADANALNVITQSVVVMAKGSGPEIVGRKTQYDGNCPSGNTTPLTTGFAAPKDFPGTKAYCSHPNPDQLGLLRCSAALGRGHVYVQIEVDAFDEKDAATNLTKALAAVAARLAQLPA